MFFLQPLGSAYQPPEGVHTSAERGKEAFCQHGWTRALRKAEPRWKAPHNMCIFFGWLNPLFFGKWREKRRRRRVAEGRGASMAAPLQAYSSASARTRLLNPRPSPSWTNNLPLGNTSPPMLKAAHLLMRIASRPNEQSKAKGARTAKQSRGRSAATQALGWVGVGGGGKGRRPGERKR